MREARADRRGVLRKAGIEKMISPHKLRYIDATNRFDAGADRVDIKALVGHESVSTTQFHQRRAVADGAGGGEVVMPW